jgi:hypothetical protein
VSMIVMVMYLIISEFWCWYSSQNLASIPLSMRKCIASTLIRVCGMNFNYYKRARLQSFAPCSSHFTTNWALLFRMINRRCERAHRVRIIWVNCL